MSTEPLIGYSHLHATGVRTFNLLISFSEGANHAVEEIYKGITLTVIKSNISQGDLESLTTFRNEVLSSLLSHPHTASAYVIGTGEEPIPLYTIIGELLAINSATEYLSINNGSDEAMAVKIAIAGATDLSTQSLPGLREIDTPKVILGYEVEPKILPDLVTQADIFGITLDVRKFSADPYADLRNWMLEGTHVVISFIPSHLYPVGTLLTPVINVASDSEFHNSFIGDFDITSTDSPERIIEEVLGVFSRVRTFSEYTRTTLPVMTLPLQQPDQSKNVQLVIANEALNTLATDIAHHFENVDYLGFVSDWKLLPESRGLLIALTTGSPAELEQLESAPTDAQVMNLSEVGSLGALAEAAARFISS